MLKRPQSPRANMPALSGHQDLEPEPSSWLGDLGSPVVIVVSQVPGPGNSSPLEPLENGFWIREPEDQVPDGGDLDGHPLFCGFYERERGPKGGRDRHMNWDKKEEKELSRQRRWSWGWERDDV